MAKRPGVRAPSQPVGANARSAAQAKAAAVAAQEASPAGSRTDRGVDASVGMQAPYLDMGDTFRDIGTTGLRQFGGWVREEFIPNLQGRHAAVVYREMGDNCSIIGAVLFAIMQSMRKVEWRVEPAVADDGNGAGANFQAAAIEGQKFVESLMDDMDQPWSDFITEALSMIRYGFAPHEIVYKVRNGKQPARTKENPKPPPSSKHNDGMIGLHRLPIRGQDTILKWFFGENGEILGLTQQPYIGPMIDIPAEKLLLFRPSAHKNNPEGFSVLRTAYRAWFFLKRFEEQEAILFERMSGVPMVTVPIELLNKAATGDAEAVAMVAAYKELTTNVRIDEQMGIVMPSNTYSTSTGLSNVKMYDFQLVTPASGRTSVEANTTIERYVLQILYTVLADFIQMGHSSRGTQSLAISKVDLFFQAIAGWLGAIADVLNRKLLPRLWELNGLDDAAMPKIVPDMAQRVDLAELGAFILALSQSGMPLFPDIGLESFLKDAAGLPDSTEDADWMEAKDPADDRMAAEQAAAAKQGVSADPSGGGVVTKPTAQAQALGEGGAQPALAKLLRAALAAGK